MLFRAKEFDLAKGDFTGRAMEFVATSAQDAARKLAYTLNVKYGRTHPSRWGVTRSGRVVARRSGDITWIVESALGARGGPSRPLKSTIESPKVEKQVRAAFRAKFRAAPTDVFYEHGQWWARRWDPGYGRDEERTWAVVDAVPGVRHGLDFEEVG